MLDTLIKIFLPIIIGYLLIRCSYLSPKLSKDLKTFVIRVTVPALVFMRMYKTDTQTLKQLIPVASSYVVITALLILISWLILNRIKDSKTKAAYMITIVWGNYGWIGYAVLNEALGSGGFDRGVFFTALWWPVLYIGAYIVAKITGVDGKLDIKNYIINMAVPVISLILGITLNVLSVSLPVTLTYTLNKFSDMTVTIILFSVGLSISLKDSLKLIKKTIVPVILRPVIGIICGIITITILQISDPLSKKAILIESCMPVAIFTVVIGDMFNLDEKLMSSILIISTLFSLLTIPLSLYYIT